MKKTKAKYPLPIREWSEDDRPREKLLKYGEYTLSNAELQRLNSEAADQRRPWRCYRRASCCRPATGFSRRQRLFPQKCILHGAILPRLLRSAKSATSGCTNRLDPYNPLQGEEPHDCRICPARMSLRRIPTSLNIFI